LQRVDRTRSGPSPRRSPSPPVTSPKAPPQGIRQFINRYSQNDRVSREDNHYDSHREAPVEHRRGRHHHERRSCDDLADATDDAPSVQSAPAANQVDDRPLAGAAFKAWLGGDKKSTLEEKVESAFIARRQTVAKVRNGPYYLYVSSDFHWTTVNIYIVPSLVDCSI